MKIKVLSRSMFRRMLSQSEVTSDNVENIENTFFISINNPDDLPTDVYFPQDKENVKVLFFPDIEQDREIPLIGTGKTKLMKAMTQEQAAELFEFIKKHKDKEQCIIHCTAGISRSGAIGLFINEFMSQNYNEFKRENPSVLPNYHVYRLLHDEWYKSHSHNDSVTGKPLNTLLLDEAGQMPVAEYKGRSYKKGDTVLMGGLLMHPDGSKTYVTGVDPYRMDVFEQFWLETNQYYGMVEESELKVLEECHPKFDGIMDCRKKMRLPGEFEAFAEFGYGDDYTGIRLQDWLIAQDMIKHFTK